MRPIKTTEAKWDALGKAAYDAYCEKRKWKAFNGDQLPQWVDVKPDIKEGWVIAVKAVVGALNNNCSRCFEPLEQPKPVVSTVVTPTFCASCGRDMEYLA